MNINTLLRKMAVLLERRQDALFSYDVNKQKNYIEKLGEPQDEIERSYFQYKCQMRFNGTIITALLNVASFPLIMYYWKRYGRNVKIKKLKREALVFLRDGKPENILPTSLIDRYKKVESNPIEGIVLNKEDKKFVRKIIHRYPFSWQFILKCLIKIGRYSFVITEYSPEAIAVCAEYSFTSSMLTAYCRQKQIKHIDVMHGEKMYYMRDAFFEFDECFVWNKYYKDMLTSMKAVKKQFVIEVPQSLKFKKSGTEKKIYDYTYYLGAESEMVLREIAKILKQLQVIGKKISIRPHPRYSDMKMIEEIFAFVNVEDGNTVSIEQSLLQTQAAISLYSTVLTQALCNSIPIIIDNISNPYNFSKLKELGYICLYQEHELLSEVLDENSQKLDA